MTIKQIKKKMKEYRDFYGGDLLNVGDIDVCKTKGELLAIVNKHKRYMEMMLIDALTHIENFEKEIF
jgi:hypothetical protein